MDGPGDIMCELEISQTKKDKCYVCVVHCSQALRLKPNEQFPH